MGDDPGMIGGGGFLRGQTDIGGGTTETVQQSFEGLESSVLTRA